MEQVVEYAERLHAPDLDNNPDPNYTLGHETAL